MDPIILVLIALVVIIITALFFLNKSTKEPKPDQNVIRERNPAQLRNVNPNLPRNLQRNRLRNRERVANRNRIDEDDGEDDFNEDADMGNRGDLAIPNNRNLIQAHDGDSDDDDFGEKKKIGTKKLAKLEEKAARRERNEQIVREREEKKAREEEIYLERKKQEELEAKLEKEKELAEKKAKEEQEKREYEEYLKLKEQFTVDEVGEDSAEGSLDSENLLNEFVNFIKKSKIVVLEDLAAEFKLKTQDAINRVNQVQEMGLLTGVMDDRGKFIYVSEDELMKVKNFIEQRGRVNIMELAKASSELINLKPVVNETIEIEAS